MPGVGRGRWRAGPGDAPSGARSAGALCDRRGRKGEECSERDGGVRWVLQHFVLFARFFPPFWLGPTAGTALPCLYIRGARLRSPRHCLTESCFQTGLPPFERTQLAQVAQQFLSCTPSCTPFCRPGACRFLHAFRQRRSWHRFGVRSIPAFPIQPSSCWGARQHHAPCLWHRR